MAKKFNLKVGEGLLNPASQASKQAEEFNIVMLPLASLEPNEENEGISLDDIKELSQSILDNGLDQNFVVVPKTNGNYKILSGHRRRLACLELVDRGHSEWNNVPCIIKDISKITLPLDDEMKELFALLTTNTQRRNETLSDKLKMREKANRIYDALKDKGELVGQRRKWLAEHLNISDSQIKNLDYIDTHAEPEIREAIEKDLITPAVANEIAHLNPEDQQAIHEEKGTDFPTMKAEDVGNWKKEREIKKNTEAAEKENRHILTTDLLSVSKERIDYQLDKLEHGLEVTDTEYQNLLKMQEKIEKTLAKIQQLLVKAEVRKKQAPMP